MRREGSALNGLGVVVLKELSDHLTSVLMRVCEVLVVLIALAALYFAIQQVRDTTAEDPFLFLRLFTRAREGIPITFIFLLSYFFVPILAIVLGFDAVSSEHNRRTLSRILAQPIYRDALLFGKFIAGLFTISISLVALWLLVFGLGLFLLGVPPNAEETARAFIFLLVTIAYAGVWLALALLFSIVFRSAATAAFVAFGLWLVLTFLWPMVLAPMVAAVIAPPDPGYTALGLPTPENIEWGQILSRLSPTTLYNEIALVLLNPDDVSARALGPIYLAQLQGAARGALPLGQSLLIAWPDIVGLVAGSILLFTIGYMVFQRQEVRA
jgi:ABC-2 type transport system permease protein